MPSLMLQLPPVATKRASMGATYASDDEAAWAKSADSPLERREIDSPMPPTTPAQAESLRAQSWSELLASASSTAREAFRSLSDAALSPRRSTGARAGSDAHGGTGNAARGDTAQGSLRSSGSAGWPGAADCV